MPKGIRIRYTAQMEEFLHQHKHMLRREMTALFNQTFGTNISIRTLGSKCERIGALTGRTGRFEHGNEAWNHGTKGVMKPNNGSFKKGSVPHNTKPVGWQRISKDGYVLVKVAEPDVFKPKHIVVWEEVHGEVPKTHNLLFINKDKQDFRLENLMLVSKPERLRLNRFYAKYSTPETHQSCILLAQIGHKISCLKKEVAR